MSGEAHDFPPNGSGPARSPGGASGELGETLAELELSLRQAAERVARAREQLGEGRPKPRALTEERAPSANRARLREGPLGHLFRSTVEQNEALLAGAASEPTPRTEHEPIPTAEHEPIPRVADQAIATAADLPIPSPTEEESTWLEAGVAEVEPRIARIVATTERQLGAEHQDTLWAVHDLVAALAKAGDARSARRLAARLVATRTRALGPDHPHTIRAYQLRGSL